jgi:uncharacterized membrane protein HdeD (DUF308 family)
MLGSTFLIVRGILGILVGVVAFLWPGLTIAVLVGIFALYAVIDGVSNLIFGLTSSTDRTRTWALVAQGFIGIAAGIMAVVWPGITTLALIWFIASWAVVTGILEIAAAIRLRREVTGEWLMMLSGVLSVLFGVMLFAFPLAGAVGIAWLLGSYAAAAGVVLLALGIRLRSRTLATA